MCLRPPRASSPIYTTIVIFLKSRRVSAARMGRWFRPQRWHVQPAVGLHNHAGRIRLRERGTGRKRRQRSRRGRDVGSLREAGQGGVLVFEVVVSVFALVPERDAR